MCYNCIKTKQVAFKAKTDVLSKNLRKPKFRFHHFLSQPYWCSFYEMILTLRKALRQLCYTFSTSSDSFLRLLEPYWQTAIWEMRVPYPDFVFSTL